MLNYGSSKLGALKDSIIPQGNWRTCVVRCVIWYHVYNLKNVKNTHGGVLILVKLQTESCNSTKINTPP